MPLPLALRLLLYGLIQDSDLRRAVAYWYVSQGNRTLREVAREYGVDHTTLFRASERFGRLCREVCESEQIGREQLVDPRLAWSGR